MLGNFTYDNPTRLHFGPDALERLRDELPAFGPVVQLAYGGGSIKETGLYDQVVALLKECGKTVVDDGGVMPNPTAERLLEGRDRAREKGVDFILAVGGGSVADYAKAVSVSVHCDEDPWERYYLRFEEVECDVVPVGCVLTMAGTGSEMNGGAVITNRGQKLKIGHVFGPEAYPKFAILNPELTFTVPKRQMVAGVFDVVSHVMEQYFSGEDDNVSDYLMEGLMRSLVASSRAAVADPRDYEARSNIMWAARPRRCRRACPRPRRAPTGASRSRSRAPTPRARQCRSRQAPRPCTHRLIAPYGLPKFARFARTVWGVEGDGCTDEELAETGIAALEAWAREIGCVMRLSELGVDEGMLDGIAEAVLPMEGGYHPLSRDEVVEVLRASL